MGFRLIMRRTERMKSQRNVVHTSFFSSYVHITSCLSPKLKLKEKHQDTVNF
ncbi:Hypothetical predicted protein [Mytilus galloprovincialis]|uniref:Uncharacterized protein n=1 Tax=Mytilus galloprovincialis TaxID=29158 RepID=A0A8B6C8K9_MYTGA|nr:Hypothetical predicted protein [Mytilus galloprovincialis]